MLISFIVLFTACFFCTALCTGIMIALDIIMRMVGTRLQNLFYLGTKSKRPANCLVASVFCDTSCRRPCYSPSLWRFPLSHISLAKSDQGNQQNTFTIETLYLKSHFKRENIKKSYILNSVVQTFLENSSFLHNFHTNNIGVNAVPMHGF